MNINDDDNDERDNVVHAGPCERGEIAAAYHLGESNDRPSDYCPRKESKPPRITTEKALIPVSTRPNVIRLCWP